MERYEFVCPCHFGLESVLKQEILDLGYEIVQVEDGKVTFAGDYVNVVKNEDGSYKKLCDGIGMQSYIGGYGQQAGCMNDNDIKKIEQAIRMINDLGVKVHVTEMSVRNFDKNQVEKHAKFYGKLFEMYKRINEEEVLLSNVSIWGITDNPNMRKNDYSYAMNGPYCGLFTQGCERKDAYYEALKALRD